MKIILTGATGFVGEGVLLECFAHAAVTEVLAVSRKRCELKHPKLKQCILTDFMHSGYAMNDLKGYDACFYCAGVSSPGMDEKTYTAITYHTTITFAETLLNLNPNMIFNFISGRSTDSSERGQVMWARIKGKTENTLRRMPFKAQYNFRPGFMKPTQGQRNVKCFYKIISPVWPLLFPAASCTMKEEGLALINSVLKDYPKHTLEVDDIKDLAIQ